MNTYRYRAARADGTVVRGRVDATDEKIAATSVTESGLFPLSVREARSLGPARPASRRELAAVFRSVALLTEAGVTVERALAASEPVATKRLAAALRQARDRLRQGVTLSKALADTDGVVPSTAIGVIAAGERGSQLAKALGEVAEQMERDAELADGVRSALAYPALILLVGLISVLVMGTVVIPRFASLLSDLGVELPWTTRALLAGSDLFQRFGWLMASASGGGVVAFVVWRNTPAGRLRVDTDLLRLPVVGRIRLALASARTCRAFAAMTATGMPLLSALDAATRATGDAAVSLRLSLVRDRVARGERLTTSLEAERALLPSALQLVAVGEASGRVALMARRAGDLASREAEHALKTVVNLLEPGLVVTLGGLVAFAAAALLQAVYSIRPGVAF